MYYWVRYLYYGGGANTIYDAVEAGVPIATLEGNHHTGRFAAATYNQMDVMDTVVYDLSQYVDKVISIATDKGEKRSD